MGRPLDFDQAWETITDTFPIGQTFTLREAALVAWPHLGTQLNNISRAASILRKGFETVEAWTRENLGEAHVQRVGKAGTPAVERWQL